MYTFQTQVYCTICKISVQEVFDLMGKTKAGISMIY